MGGVGGGPIFMEQSLSLWRDKDSLSSPCVCLVVKARRHHLGVFENLEPLGFGIQ